MFPFTALLQNLLYALPVSSLFCPNTTLPGHGGSVCTPSNPSTIETPTTTTILASTDILTTALVFTETNTITGEPWAPLLPPHQTGFSTFERKKTAKTLLSTKIPISTSVSNGTSEPELKAVVPTLPRPYFNTTTFPRTSSPRNIHSSEAAAWGSSGAALSFKISQFHSTAAPSAWNAYVSRVSPGYAAMGSRLSCLEGCIGTGTGNRFIRPTATGSRPPASANATGFDGNATHRPVFKKADIENGVAKQNELVFWIDVLLFVIGLVVLACFL